MKISLHRATTKESEKHLYINIRTTLKLHIIILFLSYSPTVRIKCYLKQQEKDPLSSVHSPLNMGEKAMET